jgi:ribosomal protein S27E
VVLVIAAIFGIICAAISHSKGRSVIGWFFLGFFFGIFALIAILLVSNLKEAKAKEAHMEMEQRRLSEQLRQERIKTEHLRRYTHARLDVHDKELKIDTRHIGHLLEQPNTQPILGDGQGLSEGAVSIDGEPKSRHIKTQCPHCQAKFKVHYEHKGKKTKCPKCTTPFVIARFVESTAVEKCSSCGRMIEKPEKAYVFDNQIVCIQCDERLRKGPKGIETKMEGWYYQKQDTAVGPLPLEVVKQLAQEGKINSSTFVWHESLNNWIPAGKVGELGYGD